MLPAHSTALTSPQPAHGVGEAVVLVCVALAWVLTDDAQILVPVGPVHLVHPVGKVRPSGAAQSSQELGQELQHPPAMPAASRSVEKHPANGCTLPAPQNAAGSAGRGSAALQGGCPPLPEAPAAVRGPIRALAHCDHLPRAEGFPQEHREGALDVQDGGGPLPGTPGTA